MTNKKTPIKIEGLIECTCCAELMRKEFLIETDGYECPDCGDVFASIMDAEDCCSEEDDEE